MRLRWLARYLAPRLQAWAKDRPPDFQITGARRKVEGPHADVYLRRWHLVRPRWWRPGLYLHQMLGDDDAALHDHPYWSVSLCLADGLRERYHLEPAALERLLWENNGRKSDGKLGVSDMVCRIRHPRVGDIIYRSSTMAHQLTIVKGEPWTLFFTGPRLPKEWGFWCRRGWVHFKQYTKRSDATTARPGHGGTGTSGVGVGCGEE